MTLVSEQRDLEVPAPTVTVVICAYTAQRWTDICAAVQSVRAQSQPAAELIVVIDYNDELLARATNEFAAFDGVQVVANTQEKGLSGARNSGVARASSDIVAFLDDDASADADWLATMTAHYGDPAVVGVGGYARPEWPRERPTWMPTEFDWVVGCSYVGQPTTVSQVRNFIGANMSIRRATLTQIDGFSSAIGRVDAIPLGCEETELCIRIRQHNPDAQLLFDPAMRVSHRVSTDRIHPRYFFRRCYSEGLSKALVSDFVGPSDALSSEWAYTTRVLPMAVLRGLVSPGSGGLTRALMVVLGLAVTTAGYLRGRARLRTKGGQPESSRPGTMGQLRNTGRQGKSAQPANKGVAQR